MMAIAKKSSENIEMIANNFGNVKVNFIDGEIE